MIVKSFGYTPYTTSVVIKEKAVTDLSVALQPAPFDVTDFSIPKTAVNPANPGLIGSIEANFSVTGPGKGEIHVSDATGTEVYTRTLPDFTTWDQSFTWDVHTATGLALPDGAVHCHHRRIGPRHGSPGEQAGLDHGGQLVEGRPAKHVERQLRAAVRSGFRGAPAG